MNPLIKISGLLLLLAIGVSGQPNKTAPAKKKDAQTQGQPTVINLENCEESAAHSTAPDGNPPKWYASIERALAHPDWWLVIIAFLTGCAMTWLEPNPDGQPRRGNKWDTDGAEEDNRYT